MNSSPSFAVWFDLSCDDFLALEVEDMTPALQKALDDEGVQISYVQADTRKAAVAKAFPNKAVAGKPVVNRGPTPHRFH